MTEVSDISDVFAAAKEIGRASPRELAEIAIECLDAIAEKYPDLASYDADGVLHMAAPYMFAKACMLKLRDLQPPIAEES